MDDEYVYDDQIWQWTEEDYEAGRFPSSFLDSGIPSCLLRVFRCSGIASALGQVRAPYISSPEPCTLKPKPFTLNPKPQSAGCDSGAHARERERGREGECVCGGERVCV